MKYVTFEECRKVVERLLSLLLSLDGVITYESG